MRISKEILLLRRDFLLLYTNEELSMTEVLVAVLGVFASVLVLVGSKYFERKAAERETKERKYINFLESLLATRAGEKREMELTTTLPIIYLVGSSEVVKHTKGFISIFEGKNQGTNQNKNPDLKDIRTEQNKLFSKMIASMRKDLYGSRSAKDFPTELGLTIFTNH